MHKIFAFIIAILVATCIFGTAATAFADWDYYFNAAPYGSGSSDAYFGTCYTWWCY